MSSSRPVANPTPVRLRPVPIEPSPLDAVARAANGRLPGSPTSLIGRDADAAAARALIEHDGVRLLTLTGPGGVGKTRLALRIGEVAAPAFAEGVVFVPLAAITDPKLVLPTIARAFGLHEIGTLSPHDLVADYLRERRLLVILDNFEQVRPAARHLAPLLTCCPDVVLLVTSRALLHIAGEQVFPVAPLALPDEDGKTARRQDGKTATREIGKSAAVQLFVARARAVDPRFVLGEENAATVAAICHRLDGLPLAIELAAARLRHLSPADLLARLGSALPLLTAGPDDAPDRLRTMRQAIAWSYDLLSVEEQSLFRHLAIFAGGFTLDAAEWMLDDDRAAESPPPATPSSLDLIASLVDKSLLQAVEAGGATRFEMLETIREFGLEQLAASGEVEAIAARHAAWCLAFAERQAPDFFLHDDVVARSDAVATEHPNLLAALDHLDASGAADAQVRLAALLGPFWFHRAFHGVGRSYLRRALARPTGRPADEAVALANLARLATFQGNFATAAADLERATARATDAGNPRALAFVVTCRAILALLERRFDASRALAAQAEAIAENAGAPLAAAFARFVRARAMQYGGDLDGAATLYVHLLATPPPPRFAAAIYRHSLAMVARAQGQPDVALPFYAAAIEGFFATGEFQSTASCLEDIAASLAGLGRTAAAARLFGAAAAFRTAIGIPMLPPDAPDYDRAVTDVRARLGSDAFAAAWTAGGALSLDEAIAELTALAEEANQVTVPSLGDAGGLGKLTAREREILRLVVDGRSDKEIAAVLGISPRTVSKHVASIRAKLAAPSRTAAATFAVRDGLIARGV